MAGAGAQHPKMPAGGGFGVWRGANFDMLLEEAKRMPGGIGRGGIARKASEFWKAMSDAEKAPWTAKFQEQLATFREYQQSDSYVKPEKKESKKGKRGASKKLIDEAHGTFFDAVATFEKFYEDVKLEPEEEEVHDNFFTAVVAFKEFCAKTNKVELEESEDEDVNAEVPVEEIKQLVETHPRKKQKVEASELSDEEAALMAEAKKEGLQKKLESMMENSRIASKGVQALLNALRTAGGKVPEAKRALLGE